MCNVLQNSLAQSVRPCLRYKKQSDRQAKYSENQKTVE